MSTYAADDHEAIKRRLDEILADKQVAMTGTSAPVTGQEPKTEADWTSAGTGIDYSGWKADYGI